MQRWKGEAKKTDVRRQLTERIAGISAVSPIDTLAARKDLRMTNIWNDDR